MLLETAFVLSMVREPRPRPIGTIDASTFILLNVIPASAGTDTQLRAFLGWPIQFPLNFGQASNERFVLTPRVVFWTDRPLTTFDVRFGFRRNIPVDGNVIPIIGLGTTIEIEPVPRATASPEIGLRIGRNGGDLFAIYVVAQGDFGAKTEAFPYARGTLSVGWGVF